MAPAREQPPSNGTVVRIVLIVAGTALLLYAAYLVRSILTLVVVAIFLAAGLDPAVRRLEDFKLKRGQAVAVIFLTLLLLLTAFAVAVIPQLVSQVTDFATNLPDYVQNIAQNNPEVARFVQENDIADKLRSATNDVPKVIGSSAGRVLGVAGSILGSLFNMLTVLILTIYFLLSFSRLRQGSLKLVPKSKRAQTGELLDPILEKIGGYIAGQVAVALIAGGVGFVYLSIVGIPSPVALALWITIAALIPLIGATLGAIPSVVVAFFVSVPLGIGTLIFFIFYQQIENYLIHPRIMTKAVDISPAAVLLAALVGASLLGFIGALMAIPLAASIKLVAQEIMLPRLDAS